MWHTFYEINRASLEPFRLAAKASARLFDHPFNPVAYTPLGRSYRVACETLEQMIGVYNPNGIHVSELEAARRKMVEAVANGPMGAKILPFIRPTRAAS